MENHDSSILDLKIKAKRKWRLLSNTLKAITLLKHLETHTMNNLDELIREINMTQAPPVKRSPSLITECIDEHKLREQFFDHVKKSDEEDLKKIKEFISKNPKKYAISSSSPNSLVNKPLGFHRPLYEASMLGYSDTVNLLIEHGADPRLKSGKREDENCLDVACRWRHQNVVKILLESSDWSLEELRHAMKNTSEGVKNLIRDRVKEKEVNKCECLII